MELIFSIRGVPVTVDPLIVLLCIALNGFLVGGFHYVFRKEIRPWHGVAGGICLFSFAVIHELSHATIGSLMGAHITEAHFNSTIFAVGAYYFPGDVNKYTGLGISLAGPGCDILLGLVTLSLAWLVEHPAIKCTLKIIGWISIAMGVCNLTPFPGADGDHVLMELRWLLR